MTPMVAHVWNCFLLFIQVIWSLWFLCFVIGEVLAFFGYEEITLTTKRRLKKVEMK